MQLGLRLSEDCGQVGEMKRLLRYMHGRFSIDDVEELGRPRRRIDFPTSCFSENVGPQHDRDLDSFWPVAVCPRRMLIMLYIMVEGTEIAHVERPRLLRKAHGADATFLFIFYVHPTGGKQSQGPMGQ